MPSEASLALRKLFLVDFFKKGKDTHSAFAASSGKLVQQASIFYRHGQARRDITTYNYVLEPGIDPRSPYMDVAYETSQARIHASWRVPKDDFNTYKRSNSSVTHAKGLRMQVASPDALFHRVTFEDASRTSPSGFSASKRSWISNRSLFHRPRTIVASFSGSIDTKFVQPSSLMSYADPKFVKSLKSTIGASLTITDLSAASADFSLKLASFGDSEALIDAAEFSNVGIFRFGSTVTTSSLGNAEKLSFLNGEIATFRVSFSAPLPIETTKKPNSNQIQLSGSYSLSGIGLWTLIGSSGMAIASAWHSRGTKHLRMILIAYVAFVLLTNIMSIIV